MRTIALFACLALLSACAEDFKHPSAGNPQSMSADTLCYRAAFAKDDQAIRDEIAARNLDCARILETQRLVPER